MKSSYEYIIPAVLALVLSLVLAFSVPIFSTRYHLGIEETELLPPGSFKCFEDLDQDGISEIVELFYNQTGNLSVRIRYLNESTINQFNLPGKLPSDGKLLYLNDINEDGLLDIFICTEKNDSIYLNIIDDVYARPTISKSFALDPINQYNDNGDHKFIPGGCSDINGDGSLEFVMAINGGYSLQPRRVYAIDYRKQSVLRSPLSGAAIYGLDLFDLDNDGSDEVILSTTATANFKSSFPYMDTTTYLMVLDDQLNFFKTPVPLTQPLSWSSVDAFVYQGKRYLLTMARYDGRQRSHTDLAIFDDSLNRIKHRSIKERHIEKASIWREGDGRGLENLWLAYREYRYALDFNLEFTDSIRVNMKLPGYNIFSRSLDLDANGKMEYVVPSENEIAVYRDTDQRTSIDIQGNILNPRILISALIDGEEDPVLVAQMDRELMYLSYSLNKWFRFRFILHPMIFLLLFGVFYLLGSLQNKIIRRRFEKDRLISQLQLQAIKNQLDPHFTYNALNAVGSLIYKGEKDLAYRYLKGLTDLLRLVSGDTSDVTWTLKDEFSFVSKFLEIEKLRFREKFTYNMLVEEELEGMKLPKLSVLTFVENAIKHGLRQKRSERRLDLSAASFEDGLRIRIADNGIGREAAAKHRDGEPGNGIEMMERYFKQFNEATGLKAHFKISDIFKKNNQPAGTLVEIFIK